MLFIKGDRVKFSYRPENYPKLLIADKGVVHEVHETYYDIYTANGLRSIPTEHVKRLGKHISTGVRVKTQVRKPPTKKQTHVKSVKKRKYKKKVKHEEI